MKKKSISKVLIISLAIVGVVVCVVIFKILNNRSEGTRAASNSQAITSQSDWDTGAKTNIDTSASPGSISLTSSISDAWTSQLAMTTAREGAATVAVNGKIYAIGGCTQNGGPTTNRSNKNEMYDPSENTWTTKLDMPTRRGDAAAVAVGDKIYVFGGDTFICRATWYNWPGDAVTTLEVYDTVNNTWESKTGLSLARTEAAAATVNGKIYIIGGYDNAGNFLSTVEEYDPASDSYTPKASISPGRSALAAAVYDNKVYAVGGIVLGPAAEVASNQMYDPAGNSWSDKTSMSVARSDLGLTTLNNKIYAVGGHKAGAVPPWTANEEYDPVGNSWTTKANLTVPGRSNLGLAAVGTRMYAIGGWDDATMKNTNEAYPGVSTYNSPGTHTSASTQITNPNLYQWQTFTATYTKPANTDISFKFRTSTDASTWTSWTASQTPASGTPLTISALVTSSTGPPGGETFYKYIQVETTLTSYDGVATPTLDDYTIDFHTNVAPSKPTAATAVIAP